MTDQSVIRVTLLVLYSPQLEECRRFYRGLGLSFTAERHGQGPEQRTGALRLGLAVNESTITPALAPGRHVLTDPDGRTVEVTALRTPSSAPRPR
ncbi:glyoxalase/bleomycin resistance/dioxygenase family protein [Streptomyces sp. A3M-1-3]|uniref:glyoxalase/bleomycin resistance/dioxygenase family protein n=1 Tax=Streptomyces sp. A3M-1-3 TaxID=2962044 RepID=UPI0020B75BAF|nr:glyoxalase/bleomycin resistance/dioxygenase family protein [Streptomyces sp. A3M-1-3]MCP3818468.1 glyoxalase/bleomycin resistance/dioxygenase family protein [Streptomyces sp. A3M-1-3]